MSWTRTLFPYVNASRNRYDNVCELLRTKLSEMRRTKGFLKLTALETYKYLSKHGFSSVTVSVTDSESVTGPTGLKRVSCLTSSHISQSHPPTQYASAYCTAHRLCCSGPSAADVVNSFRRLRASSRYHVAALPMLASSRSASAERSGRGPSANSRPF